MKISPIAPPSVGGAQGQQPAFSTRALRMSTNATPGRVDMPPEEAPSIPDATEAPADEATQPLSPQYAALAKQRRALQVKEREIAEREKALQSQSGTQPAGLDVARLKSDPLGVLLEAGVTYEQLTEAVLSSQDTAHISALKAEIAALKGDFEKKLTDRDSQQEQQALAQMRREATNLVAQGDDFEMVRETRSIPKVMELIERTYRETGEVIDVKEALTLVEEELFKDAERLAGLKKVQAKFAPPAPQPAQPPQQQRHMRTLTNRDTAQVPMSAKARALAAFNGTLRR